MILGLSEHFALAFAEGYDNSSEHKILWLRDARKAIANAATTGIHYDVNGVPSLYILLGFEVKLDDDSGYYRSCYCTSADGAVARYSPDYDTLYASEVVRLAKGLGGLPTNSDYALLFQWKLN
jgi:hypothetical protein